MGHNLSPCIIIFQTDFISRLKYKISSKTEQNTNSKDLVGEIYGIDVSHHQGKIEWGKVKKWKNKKLDFVYIKATRQQRGGGRPSNNRHE